MLFDSGCILCSAQRGPVCACCEACFERARPSAFGDRIEPLHAHRVRWVLDDRLQHVIAGFKYRGERRLASWFGLRLAPLVPLLCDVVTWVPTSPERRRQRGFDQSEELARALSRQTGIACRDLLHRARRDPRQTGRSRDERASGPTLAATGPSPPVVLIVDDIVTTGASLKTAAHALAHAGADRAIGLTIAATPQRGQTGRLQSGYGREIERQAPRNF